MDARASPVVSPVLITLHLLSKPLTIFADFTLWTCRIERIDERPEVGRGRSACADAVSWDHGCAQHARAVLRPDGSTDAVGIVRLQRLEWCGQRRIWS